jgi:hypothetical protein
MRIDRSPDSGQSAIRNPQSAIPQFRFATSAAGHIVIRLHADGETRRSCELFGDSLDRTVPFEDGDVASLAGKPVTMEIDMRDADIYSFRFDDGETPPAGP